MLKERRPGVPARGATRRVGTVSPSDAWRTPAAVDLMKTIVALKSVEEAERFFRDLCTIPELQTLAARWQVARLLEEGVHYGEIARRTGASTATITRINTWRRFGTGGYRLLLNRTRGSRA